MEVSVNLNLIATNLGTCVYTLAVTGFYSSKIQQFKDVQSL